MKRASGLGPRASGRVVAAVALCAALLVGCGVTAPPRVTAADAERSHVAQGELERGRSLLVTKCGGACHIAPLPSQHTAREWPGMLDEMSERSGLTLADRRALETYVVAFARN